jgi:hypothetical protein
MGELPAFVLAEAKTKKTAVFFGFWCEDGAKTKKNEGFLGF